MPCLQPASDHHPGPDPPGLPVPAPRSQDRPAEPALGRRRDLPADGPGLPVSGAIMDWHSRKVLAWRRSHTLTTDFCVEALEEALWRHGTPEIFNTDQGSQSTSDAFTSDAFTRVLRDAGVSICRGGKGR